MGITRRVLVRISFTWLPALMTFALLHNQGGLHYKVAQQHPEHELKMPLLFIKRLFFVIATNTWMTTASVLMCHILRHTYIVGLFHQ